MAVADFELRALYRALDTQRRARGMSWAQVTREVNRDQMSGHPIATSTITGLESAGVGEGDGILQLLLWLGRTPESFVPGFADANAARFRLRHPSDQHVLRWDTRALHAALDEQRKARGLTWTAVARAVGGFSPGRLTNLAKGGRAGFPSVMRIVAWLGRPATDFTRVTP